ncbi:uncharacterized protein LOC108450841 [Gossypium arboreum]|uniref:uncharacterized protein LOC108450841 n=1 Tax=Gossypium arboreum TaxID=29729 RepID=UPI0022F1B10C|nr:uncharacterized protein LOC108450841 [Gossypium arboreum]
MSGLPSNQKAKANTLLVSSFCQKHDIDVPNLDDDFVDRGRSRRKAHKVTNMHYYHVEIFYTIIDIQLQELNICFNEMVDTKNNIAYPLVYCLIKLALILLVVTTSVERVFYTMKIVKNRLKNRIGD